MFEQIRDLLVEEYELDPATIKPESSFVNDLKLNSLELASLVVICEESFEIEIDEKDIHTLQTIQDLMDYIQNQK